MNAIVEIKKISCFEYHGNRKEYDYKEAKEQIVTIYKEKDVKFGKLYLLDKGRGLALAWHNKKGIEKEYISGVIALENLEKAAKWFNSIN
jgi:hypothetical protein